MNEETRTDAGAAHCKIGPSTLPARAVCPCHESASGGADAESGTRSHKVVEYTLQNAQAPGGLAKLPDGLTEDERARGEWGAHTILKLRDETAPNAYVHTETRAEFPDDESPFFDCAETATLDGKFGTVDAFWEDMDGMTIYIADYKTYANANDEKSYLPQGMFYAVLLKAMRETAYAHAVFFVVAGGDRSVARYEFTVAEATQKTVATIRQVEAVQPGGLFATGEEARTKCGKPSAWCKTCAHAATCPAISRAVTLVSGGGILTKPLAVRMAVVPVLESFVKGVKAEVKAALDKGERVYDAASGIEYAFAERRGRAKLADLRGLAESVIVYGVKPDDFAAAVTVSKTAVDALLKAVDDRENRKVKKADREAVYLRYFTEPGMEKYVKRIS